MKTCPRCSKTYGDHLEVCPDDQSALVAAGQKVDPLVGQLLAGRYRLEKKIGEGGMGAIYKAVHTEMGRTCAIKLLTLLSPGNDDALARFKREAKMASSIDNQHAVTIYDFGQNEDGNLFLAMEFIDGVALSRLLSEERVLPPARAIEIANQIAEALSAAHARGIIHRDLKPDNIMITRKGNSKDYVKVLDFGIAKTVADDNADNLTKTGFVLGTPVYMSPEQLLGEKLDPRSDIYSLAIIVYEMLSGRLPFEGDNQQSIMMKRITSEPVRISWVAPGISEALEEAVMNGLSRDPATRTRTVEAFAASLRTALQSGTQILGGRSTERLGGGQPPLETKAWAGFETHHDAPGVTSQPPGTRATAVDGAGAGYHVPHGAPSVTDHIAAVNAQPTVVSQQVKPAPVAPPPPLVSSSPAPAHSPSASIASEPAKRRSPLLLGGGALALVLIAIIVYLVVPFGGSGFTLSVVGAPAGSEVFVNGASRGTVAADGTLKVPGLPASTMMVQVKRDGFADFTTSVDGRKGKEQPLEALLLPKEIKYWGSEMILIPAGDFVMGDDNHEANEKPAHKVSVADYYIDKFEVTNAQFREFCDKTGRPRPTSATGVGYEDQPVVGIPWGDAAAYAKWAKKRLPREDEWEKAASWDPATQRKRMWPWGDKPIVANANLSRAEPKLSTVGAYASDVSAYGVHDMGGNAGEWVDAVYEPYEGSSASDPEFGTKNRVVRGGSINNTIEQARTTFRGYLLFEPDKNLPRWLAGIRCAISANDPQIQEFLRSRNR
ncbi:MAG TPA: bifunctional serine/threonine-protein kinase/formylglycine-generating enzyme family protein [Blastocatellia bacterium]|jgi:serine/threonine protein kinase/formylglycine-generating enzyme required for sulfatase activity|nr:bifunctional serine/threonine-protein kinase/formylglycine-generating enzyme family protein [Blastocatellia bacterium]